MLIPNLPNVLLAGVSGTEAAGLAAETAEVIRAEWKRIADQVWAFCEENHFVLGDKKRFYAQVGNFLSISWQFTPRDEAHVQDWNKWVRDNGAQLHAVRQTRTFDAWNTGGWSVGKDNNKDSLNGRDEAMAGGPGWNAGLPKEFQPLFKNDDWVGGITLIKRLWHCACL